MGSIRLFFLLFCLSFAGFSQSKYPANYFDKPLDIPLILSGTFGELRSNHFHAGLDIKTQKRTGFNVYAAAEGYVSRIKVSHWGYGKALYITHPNGYTTVYAHLKKFAPEIEAYVKKHQYEKESYEIHVFPKPSELPVARKEIVAYSGNSGSSGGPHLHYEIRDSNAKPINPMHFGIEIPDSKKPEIRAALAYTFGDTAHVDGRQIKKEISFTRQADGTLLAKRLSALGRIGFGVNAVDKQNAALNSNGIYSLEMKVNGKTHYKHSVNTFSFSESRYINALIDYRRYYKRRQRIQKCFVEEANKLSIYGSLVNNGYLNIEQGKNYKVEIIAKDFKGNTSTLIIPIRGNKQQINRANKPEPSPYFFKKNEFNKISNDSVSVAFPKRSFYNDLYFEFKHENDVVKLHNAGVPLHKNFTLTFDVSKYTQQEQDKMFIARITTKGKPYYSSTRRKENKLYTLNRTLGSYALFTDNQQPTIRPINFKDEQWLTNYNYLKLRIADKLSGIKSYRAEINGQWVLMEFDAKRGLLTYDFNDKELRGEKHTLKVIVVDNVNNTNTYIATFYRHSEL